MNREVWCGWCLSLIHLYSFQSQRINPHLVCYALSLHHIMSKIEWKTHNDSPRKEHAWYDSHRSQILISNPNWSYNFVDGVGGGSLGVEFEGWGGWQERQMTMIVWWWKKVVWEGEWKQLRCGCLVVGEWGSGLRVGFVTFLSSLSMFLIIFHFQRSDFVPLNLFYFVVSFGLEWVENKGCVVMDWVHGDL